MYNGACYQNEIDFPLLFFSKGLVSANGSRLG